MITEAIDKEIKRIGVRMRKPISSGGFLSSTVYDVRIVYSMDEIEKLDSEGFTITTDIGILLLNALHGIEEDV